MMGAFGGCLKPMVKTPHRALIVLAAFDLQYASIEVNFTGEFKANPHVHFVP